jgi:Copper resistance protein ScsC N-terminal domain
LTPSSQEFVVMWQGTRFVIFALACGSVAGLQAHSAELPAAQRQAIEGIIHDYLMENPEVLLEALRNAQEKLHRDADAQSGKGP